MSVSRARSTIGAVAWRNIYTTMKTPSLAVPPLMVPIFTLAVFAGGLSVMSRVPNFRFNGDYTAFTFIFVLVQAATMCGHFSSLAMTRDFETKFMRRLMLAVPKRWQIVAGFVVAAIVRCLVTVPILFAFGLLFQMDVQGDPIDLLKLTGLSVLVTVIAAFWSMGMGLRLRTTQAAPAMMMPIFASLFMAPAFVPLVAMQGWLHDVAEWNPVTMFVETSRGLISGDAQNVGATVAVGVGMILVLWVWLETGLRKAQAAGG